jgi:hypothetical protein
MSVLSNHEHETCKTILFVKVSTVGWRGVHDLLVSMKCLCCLKLRTSVKIKSGDLPLQGLLVEVIEDLKGCTSLGPLQRPRPPSSLEKLLVIADGSLTGTFTKVHPEAMDSGGVDYHEVCIRSLRLKTFHAMDVSELNLQSERAEVGFLEVAIIPLLNIASLLV